MPSSLNEVSARAEALLGIPVAACEPAATGGNNRLYRVSAGGQSFSLKLYAVTPGDLRDRLGTERQALVFLTRHGVEEIPRFIATDPDAGMALFEWIDGDIVAAPSSQDVKAALSFLERLHRLRTADGAEDLPFASEACLSGAEVLSQVEKRFKRLASVSDVRLSTFLHQEFRPAVGRLAGAAEAEDSSPAFLTLSPSDFGFHNALRRPDSGLVFLDFEYFGWDDPVKLAADILLHPGMDLGEREAARFVEGLRDLYGNDERFFDRLSLLYPLYALRWCMILLNAFLPERQQGALRARQLEKAQTLLSATLECPFPHG
jgi:hypothetical protein